MEDDEYYEYNLSTEDKKQSLAVSLSDDNIAFILVNKSSENEKYSALVNLSQLKDKSEAFQTINSLKEALLLLTDIIESGNIFLTEEENAVDIKFNLKTEKEEYPPFDIELLLEKTEQDEKNVEVLPTTFDYQGNKEAEEKYGKSTKNTTEYNKPIIKSDYKEPILQLEYIEPILQVHYPDGTTKSKALSPRIQTKDGKTPKLSDEQFKYIREQMNRNTEGEQSGLINTSQYSTSSVPSNMFNNILKALNYQDSDNCEVRELPSQYQSQVDTQYNQNKNVSQYSIKSETNKPLYNEQYRNRFYSKENVRNRSPPRNKTIEVAPRMIKQSQDLTQNINTTNTTTSFNINQSQIVYSNNNLQQSNIYNQYQNVASKSQILNLSNQQKQKGFAKVIPLKRINRPVKQNLPPQQDKKNIVVPPQKIFEQKQEQIRSIQQNNIPFEFTQEQQRQRFQTELRKQQEIVKAKTPQFPSVLPTQIMQIKYEYPQGIDYEQKIISQIKSQDQGDILYNIQNNINNIYYQNNQSQSIQSQILPNIYQQENQTGNNDINKQIKQQIENYNEENIDKMNNMKNVPQKEENEENEENLENNEVIEDNDNEKETEEKNEEDYEALYKNEEGFIIFRNGILRSIIHRYAEIDEIISKIQDKLLKGAKFNLIYRAFNDGDKAKIFHEKCNGHPITLVLIETQDGVRFGGFTKKTWDGNCLKKIDNDAFVFSIDTGKCFDVKKDEPAIGCYPKFGPVFFGCQIRIYDDFFTKGGTTCLKGLNYKTDKDFELNDGKRNYIVKDIEVYEIETIDI